VRSDDVAVDAVAVAKLDLDAATQRRKHLREDDLLVPDRLVTVLLHRCFALYMRARTPEYY